MLVRMRTAIIKRKMEYPAARRDDTVIEDHFGVKVADPYRWLEDPDSSETQSFVEAQNAISMPYLSTTPIRKKYNDRSVQPISRLNMYLQLFLKG